MIKKAIMLASVLILSMGIAFATSNIETTKSEDNAVAMVTGTVLDANTGEVIPNATVTLTEAEASATTDENGTFTLEGVEAGSYTLTVEAEGYEPAEQTLDVPEEGANVEITLQASM